MAAVQTVVRWCLFNIVAVVGMWIGAVSTAWADCLPEFGKPADLQLVLTTTLQECFGALSLSLLIACARDLGTSVATGSCTASVTRLPPTAPTRDVWRCSGGVGG